METRHRLLIWLFALVVVLFPNWQLSQLRLSACRQPHFVSKAPFCGVRLLLEGEIHEMGFLNIMRHSGRNPKPKHKPEITPVASSYPLVPFVINSIVDHLSVTVEIFFSFKSLEQLSEQKIKCVGFFCHTWQSAHISLQLVSGPTMKVLTFIIHFLRTWRCPFVSAEGVCFSCVLTAVSSRRCRWYDATQFGCLLFN